MVDSQIKDLQTLKSDIEKLSFGRQEKFLTLLNDALLLAGSIRGIENFSASSRSQVGKDDPIFSFPNVDAYRIHFEKQRNQKLIDLIEVKRKIDDFLREISRY